MKQILKYGAALFLVMALFSIRLNAQTSAPSGTDVPRILSYQGQITATDGIIMNGIHHITASLYSDHFGKNKVWEGGYDADIKNGIFNILLGSGAAKLPETDALDRSLWVGIKVDGSEEMKPLTQFAAAPYALNVPDKSITMAKLAPDVVLNTVKPPSIQGIVFDPCLTNNDGGINTNFVGGGCGNFTLSNYDVVSGGDTNKVDTGSSYSSIVGGYFNYIRGNKSIIGGGETNKIDSAVDAFIGGGYGNTIKANFGAIAGGNLDTVSGLNGFIGAGTGNKVAGLNSAIPGGANLKVGSGSFGFSSGSVSQLDVSASPNISFWGNVDMWLGNSDGTSRKLKFFEPNGVNFTSFRANDLGQLLANIEYQLPRDVGNNLDVLTGDGTGGLYWDNVENLGAWTITGNTNTDPATGHFLGTINNKALELHVYDGDGTANQGDKRVMRFEPHNESPNIIGGFQGNSIPKGQGNVIGGGGSDAVENSIGLLDSTYYSFIGGGRENSIAQHADYSSIVGGRHNTIVHGCPYGFLGGGLDNSLSKGSLNMFLGGGEGNTNDNDWAALVGGKENFVHGPYSFIGGGSLNYCATSYTVVTGGYDNVNGGLYATISGGNENIIDGFNDISSTIGGGSNNRILADYADYETIPGGDHLIAQSNAQTVLGAYNLAQGSGNALFGDADFYLNTLHQNDRLFIIGNGYENEGANRHNAFEVSDNGHSIVYHNDGYKVADGTTSPTPNFPAISGARYIDNTPLAWGTVAVAAGGPATRTSDFGVSNAIYNGLGWYTVQLNYVDPYSGAQVQINHGSSVTATILAAAGPNTSNCYIINASPVAFNIITGKNEFDIHICHNVLVGMGVPTLQCLPVDSPFMFTVYGRP
ncbi:MAG: hypothetical protein ABI778_01175 [Ignavibacteriota bacterium]